MGEGGGGGGGLTLVSEHGVSMGSNLSQGLQYCHEHLMVHSELILVHECLKLLMDSDQDLMKTVV